MAKRLKWWTIIKLVSFMCILTTLLKLYMETFPKDWKMFKYTNKNAGGRLFATKLFKSGDKQSQDERYRVGLTSTTQPGSSDSQPYKPSRGGPLNVVIVEEHHEVIPYWFGAAEQGLIPRTDNTLVHIDGHNDLGPPLFLPGYPFFRWPKSIKELRYFMQRNDAFIQASAMAGLISHSVWVWPEWDRVNHVADYVRANLSLGWLQTKDGKEKAFCMCEYNNTEFKCFTLHDEDDKNETMPNDGFPVPSHRCTIEKNLLVEEIVESMAIDFFSNKSWIENTNNIILDIDEDYFGCTYAIKPLLDVGITMEMIEKLDNIVATIFCPKKIEQEKQSKQILQELIQRVLGRHCLDRTLKDGNGRQHQRNINDSKLCSKLSVKSVITDLNENLLNSLEMGIHSNSLRICDGIGKQLTRLVTELVTLIINLNSQQLKQLQMVSFCLETSPRTLIPDEIRHFGVCFGANTPNNSAVLEHKTSVPEIEYRSSVLNHIIHSLVVKSPQLATVCRSVRDGYAPREHAMFIEKLVLQGLEQELPTEMYVNYDKGLLGGEHGWYRRYT